MKKFIWLLILAMVLVTGCQKEEVLPEGEEGYRELTSRMTQISAPEAEKLLYGGSEKAVVFFGSQSCSHCVKNIGKIYTYMKDTALPMYYVTGEDLWSPEGESLYRTTALELIPSIVVKKDSVDVLPYEVLLERKIIEE